jgi:hypothetical protein
MFPFLNHLGALAICFASSGLLLLLAFYFIVRSSSVTRVPPPPEGTLPPEKPAARDLEAWRMEGYEVIEVYEEDEDGVEAFMMPERVVRWAKMRNPETGEVSLMRVQVLVRPWN